MNKRTKGSEYEEKACAYLSINGVRILKQNFRCRYGEIDIIGCDGDTLVFFEVKQRKNIKSGFASEAVDTKKQLIISQVSDHFRVLKNEYFEMPVRYDVIAIDGEDISWMKNAFDYLGKGY